MNFDECAKRFVKLRDKIKSKEYSKNENYQTVESEFNKVFIDTIKKSVIEKIFFSSSPLAVFIIDFNENLELFEKEEIDFDDIAYIKKIYLHFISILSNRHHTRQGVYNYIPYLNDENYNVFCLIIRKRINYLEELLFKKGIEIIKTKDNPIPELGWNGRMKISFKRNLKIITENEIKQQFQTIKNQIPKHQTIFCNNGFELFEAFSKLHIIDKYIDFSFLFQQMKFNGYILDIKHVKFMDWLLENEYINSKEHKTFLIEKSFRSLKKCAFGTRVDLYLKLKNSIIPINSDLSE